MSSAVACSHLDRVAVLDPPAEPAGCEECLKIGGRWLHLRMCQTCGKVGCCDSSPNRHARAHAAEEGHPIARSVEPGENWSWCFLDEVMFVLAPE
jgi:uncharacterized UBP type Zn finger protein